MDIFDGVHEPTQEALDLAQEMLGAEFLMKVMQQVWHENCFRRCEDCIGTPCGEHDTVAGAAVCECSCHRIAVYNAEQVRVVAIEKLDKEEWDCTHCIRFVYTFGAPVGYLAQYGLNPDTGKISCWAN